MNILVTGATGKVGSRLVPRLLEAGHTVRLLVRDESKQPVASLQTLGAEVHLGDILEPDSLPSALAGCDAVVHLAALFRATEDAEQIHRVNVLGTKNLAKAAHKANKHMRFIFASTNLVYDNVASPAGEDEDVSPQAPYPASKVEAEEFLREFHRSARFDVRILRFAFVYGAGDPHLQEAVPLFETWHMHPAQRLHLVHHCDIAQAVIAQLRTPGQGGQTYNVADDAPITIQEILNITGEKAKLSDAKEPLTAPWKGLVATAKLRQDVGFRPLVPSLYAAQELGVL